MKHQSKAEEALNKQIRILNTQIAYLVEEGGKLASRIEALTGVRDQLANEVAKSKAARDKASERNTPSNVTKLGGR